MTDEELVKAALEARKNAYAPYSNYHVGAALLAANEEGEERLFTGCNVENASYPCGICGERTAGAKAVSEGFRKFKKIAIAGSSEEICTPCGLCRQFLFEFNRNLEVLCAGSKGNYEKKILSDLLIAGFGPESMA